MIHLLFRDGAKIIKKAKKGTLTEEDFHELPKTYWNDGHKKEFTAKTKVLKNLIASDFKLFMTVCAMAIFIALLAAAIPFISTQFIASLNKINENFNQIFYILLFYMVANISFSFLFQIYMKENLKLYQIWLNRLSFNFFKNKNNFYHNIDSFPYAVTIDSENIANLGQSIPEFIKTCTQFLLCTLLLFYYLGHLGFIPIILIFAIAIYAGNFSIKNKEHIEKVELTRKERVKLIANYYENKSTLFIYNWLKKA
ncbi:hypothetical protein [Fluviispira vulneris]|uniref:hypothetical protein n=1 Tax=Fluviispira vulneris TaxID=2763012 RepID=UPI0016486059|nr:hypothetical protein [Fluviispira vulneris]